MIKKLLAMRFSDWLIVAWSCALIPYVRMMLCVRGITTALSWAAKQNVDFFTHTQLAPADVGRSVNVAARYGPVRASCLVRSLVLVRVLKALQIESDLRIGVQAAIDNKQFFAHAWVECAGVPVNDRTDVVAKFVSFDRSFSSDQILKSFL